MLAKYLNTTPERVMWELPISRGLVYQQAILRAQDVWIIPPKPPEMDATEEDFDWLLEGYDE